MSIEFLVLFGAILALGIWACFFDRPARRNHKKSSI